MIFETALILAQSYSGCFALRNGGEYIDLNTICGGQQVQVQQTPRAPLPTPPEMSSSLYPRGVRAQLPRQANGELDMDAVTSDEIFYYMFTGNYCRLIKEGHDYMQATRLAAQKAFNVMLLFNKPIEVSESVKQASIIYPCR